MHLYIPRKLDETSAINFLDKMLKIIDEKENICLDFSKLNFARPFGTIILAEGIKDFVFYRKFNKLTTILSPCNKIKNDKNTALSFLKHFKFFEHINAPCGESTTNVHNDRGYIPLSKISKNELEEKAKNKPFQEAIESLCEEISASLMQERNIYLENMITYCFREIIRNSFEHAEIDSCVIMASNFWKTGEFEIALIDQGIGVLQSIKKQHKVKTAEKAIDMALEPGISGASIFDDDNKWGNSGFGLYILSELGKEYGSFSIYSSGVLVSISGNEKSYTDIQIGGTGVKLSLKVEHADYFPNIRESIVRKGEKKHSEKFGKIVKASKMSIS